MSDIYKKIRSFIIILFGCSLISQGCNSIDAASPVPTYIHIDSFHFVQNNLLHPYLLPPNGTPLLQSGALVPTSHQTNVAWVYYNNNPIGIFDLPVTFPVITNGPGQLEVSPGIIADGENNDVVNYTFYSTDTFSFNPQPGQTINHTPQTGYYSDDNVWIINNFEESNQSYFAPWGGSPGGVIVITGDSVAYGYHAGMIALSIPSVDSSIDSTTFSFQIPTGMAYIEFDYNSTVPFYVGLQANLSSFISSTPSYLTGIYPNSGWEKFYLEVDGFTASAQATSYNFFIKADLLPGQTSGRLLIDNIQLITN